ncbi:MAG: hypothetical protein HY513_01625 [Candidatus Aenigmarchaeota archaeon]|nr:hypothetical protein [Candidatus Aenigmarchaeota archaeon]
MKTNPYKTTIGAAFLAGFVGLSYQALAKERSDKCRPVEGMQGNVNTCIYFEPHYKSPVALQFDSPKTPKGTPFMLYINDELVNLPSDRSYVGSNGRVLLDAEAKELLLGESKKEAAGRHFMNGIVLVTSGDHLRFAVDLDKDGKTEKGEPFSSFTIKYEVNDR